MNTKSTKTYLIICLFVFVLPIILSVTSSSCIAQAAYWRCSTNSNRWISRGTMQISPWDNDTSLYINIDSNTTYQKIDGFGGCFNELGWGALSTLSQTERDKVIKALFDSTIGCKFNICRMPIGANDYAMNYYSLDDTLGDYYMNYFSIVRDRQRLIPFIKAAMVYKPDLKMWGVPWTPPAWMKTNGIYQGGSMIQTSENLTAYALYLEKAVLAYQAEGLNFYAIHIQNEPNVQANYPSCGWYGYELRDFIKNYLGPKFYNDGIHAEIWLGTIMYIEVTDTVLSDNIANPYITGVGYQWMGRFAIQSCHDKYPDKQLMQTETECGNHENDWNYANSTFYLMKTYLDGWANSYMQWNMVLDQTGLSSWGWAQCSMISIDTNTKVVTYNPQFYCAKHFSHYVKPGAYRIYSGGNYNDEIIAFKNPDGEMVLVVRNANNWDIAMAIKLGNNKIKPIVPANSFNTFVISKSSVTFIATTPTNTPLQDTVFVAGNFNDWNPGTGETGFPMTKISEREWSITLPFEPGTALKFKFARGSVSSLEKDLSGNEISNRTLITTGSSDTVRCTIDRWGDLPSSVADHKLLPLQVCLNQNYPNPFNPTTTISFDLPSRSVVSLKVFDMLGNEVSTIVIGELQAGNYIRQWNALSFASGVYFYRLQAGSYSQTKKLLLLK